MVTQPETEIKPETSTASKEAVHFQLELQPGRVPNALAIPNLNVNMEARDDDQISPLSTVTEDCNSSIVHKHRLSHTPSKLPGLRFVDCGPLQIGQTTPHAGPGSGTHSILQPTVASVSSLSPGANSTTFPGPSSSTTASLNSTLTTNCQPHPDDDPESSPPPPTSAPDFVPPSTAHEPALSSLLHPVIDTDCDDSGRNHHSESTLSAAKNQPPSQLHSTASPNHQTSASQTATAPAPTAAAAKLGTPATVTRTTPSSIRTPRSESGTDSSHYYTPATRPRGRRNASWNSSPLAARPPAPARRSFSGDSISARSTIASRSPHGQPQSTLPKPSDLTLSDEHHKTPPRRISTASRPPISNRPRPPLSAPGRIAPIRGFRPSGSRRSSFDMYNSSSRYYDDGDDPEPNSSRDRSLRALEGRYSDDMPRDIARQDTYPDDDVAESENNTADIFMTIARENASSSMPHRSLDQGSDGEQSTVVSTVLSFAFVRRILAGWLLGCLACPHIPGPLYHCPFAGCYAIGLERRGPESMWRPHNCDLVSAAYMALLNGHPFISSPTTAIAPSLSSSSACLASPHGS